MESAEESTGLKLGQGKVVNPKKRKKKDGLKVNIVQGT